MIASGGRVQMLTVPATQLRADDIMGASAWCRVVLATVYNDEDCTSVSVVAEAIDGERDIATVQFAGSVLVPILRPESAGPVHVTGDAAALLMGGEPQLIHAGPYTQSGRDTGHAICGSEVGPVSVKGDITCPDCLELEGEQYESMRGVSA